MNETLQAARASHYALLASCAAIAWMALPTPIEDLATSSREFAAECSPALRNGLIAATAELKPTGTPSWRSHAAQHAPIRLTFANEIEALTTAGTEQRYTVAYLPRVAPSSRSQLEGPEAVTHDEELAARRSLPGDFCRNPVLAGAPETASSCSLDWLLPAFDTNDAVETESKTREQYEQLSVVQRQLRLLSSRSFEAQRQAAKLDAWLGGLSKDTQQAQNAASSASKRYELRMQTCESLLQDHARSIETLTAQRPSKLDLARIAWLTDQPQTADTKHRFVTQKPSHLVAAISCSASASDGSTASDETPEPTHYLAVAATPRVVPLGAAPSAADVRCVYLAERIRTQAESAGIWEQLVELDTSAALTMIGAKERSNLRTGSLFGVSIDRGSLLRFAPAAFLLVLLHLLALMLKVHSRWGREDEKKHDGFAWFAADRGGLTSVMTAATLLVVPWVGGWCAVAAMREANAPALELAPTTTWLVAVGTAASLFGAFIVPAVAQSLVRWRRPLPWLLGLTAFVLAGIALPRSEESFTRQLAAVSSAAPLLFWVTVLNAAAALSVYFVIAHWRARRGEFALLADAPGNALHHEAEPELANPTEPSDVGANQPNDRETAAAPKEAPPEAPDITDQRPAPMQLSRASGTHALGEVEDASKVQEARKRSPRR